MQGQVPEPEGGDRSGIRSSIRGVTAPNRIWLELPAAQDTRGPAGGSSQVIQEALQLLSPLKTSESTGVPGWPATQWGGGFRAGPHEGLCAYCSRRSMAASAG